MSDARVIADIASIPPPQLPTAATHLPRPPIAAQLASTARATCIPSDLLQEARRNKQPSGNRVGHATVGPVRSAPREGAACWGGGGGSDEGKLCERAGEAEAAVGGGGGARAEQRVGAAGWGRTQLG